MKQRLAKVALFGVVATTSLLPVNSEPSQARETLSSTVLQSCEPTESRGNREIDLMFLIDQSKSLEGDRIKSLGQALTSMVPVFMDGDGSIRIALATFSRGAELLRGLSAGPLSTAEFQRFVQEVSVEQDLQGGTNYLAATQLVLDEFRRSSDPSRCKVVIWFTDGEVDIPDVQNRVTEAESVLTDFCSSETSASSKAESFRGVGIRPFVVLLTSQPFNTEQPLLPKSNQTGQEADPYRRWASVVALRGLTGDWDEAGVSVTKPGSLCDEYSDDWGELIKFSETGDLSRQLIDLVIKGTTEVPPDFCPKTETSLEGLPAGRFFEKILISVNRGGATASSPLIESPRELDRFVTGNLLVLNRANPEQAQALDDLPPGWNLELNSSVYSICLGYTFRSAEALEFVGVPSQRSIRIPSRAGDSDLTATIQLGEFERAVDLDEWRWSDSSVGLSGTTATITPNATSRQLEKLPGFLQVRPSGLGDAGEVIVARSPIIGTVRLSPVVEVGGIEELPRIECSDSDDDGGNLLRIVSIGTEVSKKPYRSDGTCSLIGGEAPVGGVVTISMRDPSIASKDGGGFGLQLVGSDAPPVSELKIGVDNLLSGQATEFFVGQERPLPNRQLDLSRSTDLSVVWSDSDESVQLGEIRLLVNLSLNGRSDKALALIIAIAASALSALIAYITLFFVIRRTARVGQASELVFLTTEIVAARQAGGAGSSVQWIDRESVVLPAFGVTKVKALDEGGRKILADRIRLEVQTANPFRPLDVVRGPWTTVASTDVNSLGLGLSVEGRKPGSALSPLGPVVIADVTSRDVQLGRFVVRLTFIVPTRGPIASFSGIQKLAQSSAISAISKAVQASVSGVSTGKRTDSSSEHDSINGRISSKESNVRPVQRDPRPDSQGVSEALRQPSDARPPKPVDRDSDTRNRRPPGASPR